MKHIIDLPPQGGTFKPQALAIAAIQLFDEGHQQQEWPR
jgi:hypothetical protein